MDGSASPRKPSVAMESRSSAVRSLEVAWRSKASRASSRIHAVAVVGDADELAAAGFDFDADARGAGVERVFEEFFDHGGRAVDDLAGGDLVGDLVGENADAAHESIVDALRCAFASALPEVDGGVDGVAVDLAQLGFGE